MTKYGENYRRIRPRSKSLSATSNSAAERGLDEGPHRAPSRAMETSPQDQPVSAGTIERALTIAVIGALASLSYMAAAVAGIGVLVTAIALVLTLLALVIPRRLLPRMSPKDGRWAALSIFCLLSVTMMISDLAYGSAIDARSLMVLRQWFPHEAEQRLALVEDEVLVELATLAPAVAAGERERRAKVARQQAADEAEAARLVEEERLAREAAAQRALREAEERMEVERSAQQELAREQERVNAKPLAAIKRRMAKMSRWDAEGRITALREMMALAPANTEWPEEIQRIHGEQNDAFLRPWRFVEIDDFSWQLGGFGMVMDINATIRNTSPFGLKDFTLRCWTSAASGTRLGERDAQLLIGLPAGKSKRIEDFTIGFVNSQSARAHCEVVDATHTS